MSDMDRDRATDESIRRWMDSVAPHGAPDRALGTTIERLRETDQPRRFVLSLPMPLAAAIAVIAVVLVGALAFRAGLIPVQLGSNPSPTPTTGSGACSLELPVTGQWVTILGHGFAPGTDVVLVIDRANGSQITVTASDRGELHTNGQGQFALTLQPMTEDLGEDVITATAGCTASIVNVSTADEIPSLCPDPRQPTELAAGAAYRSAVAADAPLHWWGFEGVGSRFILDEAGDAQASIVGSGARQLSGTNGMHAAFFDGTESYATIPEMRLRGEFTVEWWARLCGFVDNADAVIGNGTTAPNINFFDIRPRLFVGDEGDDIVAANTPGKNGDWQHWAITNDTSGTHVYLNGILDAEGDAYKGDLVVNEIARGDAGTFNGSLDELAIYDRALTADELLAHVNAR